MDNKQKKQTLKLAEQYFRDKNYLYAQHILDKVIKVDSKNSKANELLSYIYGNLGKFDLSLQLLEVACNQSDCSPEALYYLGSSQLKRSLFHQAVESFKKSISKGGECFEVVHDLGTAQAHIGDVNSALNSYKKCLKFGKFSYELFYNIARIYDELKHFDEAIIHYDKALNLKPDFVEGWSNKGNIFCELKRFDEAIVFYDKALSFKPDFVEGWSNKGKALNELKRFDEAIIHHDKALTLKPDYADSWLNKGNALYELKRFDEAIIHYDQTLTLKPDYAEGWSNKGNALNELKRFDEAIIHHDKALALKPDFAEGWSNKGITLIALKRIEEAVTHYDKALNLKSDYVEGWLNKANALCELKRFDEAIIHYDKAISLRPNYHDALWAKSLCLLVKGDFENGLLLYENRWHSNKLRLITGKRYFNEPTWLGKESLQGKVILLYGEQGLGDFIQFSRYAKLVSDLGAKVILETPESLASLMTGIEGVSQLLIKGEELPSFDYQSPLLSLPLAFKTNISNIPADKFYLKAQSNKAVEWRQKLGEKTKKRVGVVWSSMSNFKEDSKRSLMLADFINALPSNGFEYICLQKELKESDKEFFEKYKNIRFFGNELQDFSDTAALIENLDLVISSCTSVPHLSSALGKETWVLLSYVSDWRWLLDREDSPWYPSMKLYRQNINGNWNSVLDKVKSDLNGS